MKNKTKGDNNMLKLIFASLVLLAGITFICVPLLAVWVGITAHLPF